MAKRMSSPLTVFRFSCWHFSDADQEVSFTSDHFELLRLTLAGDEGDKLGDTFLHALLCLLGNLCVFWKGGFHDSRDWSKVADVSIGVLMIGRAPGRGALGG
jgi:hypothetical protein